MGRTCSPVSQCRFGGSLGLLGSLGSMESLMGSEGSYILTVEDLLLYLSDVLGDLDLDRADLLDFESCLRPDLSRDDVSLDKWPWECLLLLLRLR